MTSSQNVTIVIPEQIDKRLEEVTEATGLSKSEIGRRGILSQIEELEK